jgi:hypothetical protein
MSVIGRHSLATALRILIDLLLLFNLIALILLPWLLTQLYTHPELLLQLEHAEARTIDNAVRYPGDLPPSSYPFYLAFLYGAGLCTAWLLAEGHLILRRLERGDPFAAGQTNAFRRIGLAFCLLAALFAVKCLFYITLLTLFCAALFVLLAMIALVLAEVFRQAYLVKSENELTV